MAATSPLVVGRFVAPHAARPSTSTRCRRARELQIQIPSLNASFGLVHGVSGVNQELRCVVSYTAPAEPPTRLRAGYRHLLHTLPPTVTPRR